MSRHGFMLGLGLITVGGKSKKKRPQEASPEGRVTNFTASKPRICGLSRPTAPAFSQSALFFASKIPAKAGAVKAVAMVRPMNAKQKSLHGGCLLADGGSNVEPS